MNMTISASTIPKIQVGSDQAVPVKSTVTASIVNITALKESAVDKKSVRLPNLFPPKDYSSMDFGAFAEGHYTEF
jgi:hypothetical protein